MNYKSVLLWVVAAVMAVLGYQKYGWPGVAIVVGAIVMWILLHFTRLMTILKRAANKPMGHVGSAVMLNAKLKPGVSLMHVIAMTKSLGLLQTQKDAQPEIFRWRDAGESQVDCTFVDGKLQSWQLWRPPVKEETPEQTPVIESTPSA